MVVIASLWRLRQQAVSSLCPWCHSVSTQPCRRSVSFVGCPGASSAQLTGADEAACAWGNHSTMAVDVCAYLCSMAVKVWHSSVWVLRTRIRRCSCVYPTRSWVHRILMHDCLLSVLLGCICAAMDVVMGGGRHLYQA